MWMFTPPSSRKIERIVTGSLRYSYPEAVSVVKYGSDYVEVSYPGYTTWDRADFVYQGGHEYEVTAEEAASLQAAGYEPVEK